MSVEKAVKGVGGLVLVVAALLAVDGFFDVLYGRTTLVEYVTPGWVDFASSSPELFALIVIIGGLIIGGPFVALLENW